MQDLNRWTLLLFGLTLLPFLEGCITERVFPQETCGEVWCDLNERCSENQECVPIEESIDPLLDRGVQSPLSDGLSTDPERDEGMNQDQRDSEVDAEWPEDFDLPLPDESIPSPEFCPLAGLVATEIRLQPREVLTLDPVIMEPVNDPIEAYIWTLIQRPQNSTAQVLESATEEARADDPSTPTAQFVPDLLGDYLFELRMITQSGIQVPSEVCPQPPIQLSLTVSTPHMLYIELLWATPNDTDPNDRNGADLDLHLRLSDLGAWNDTQFDCYFGNPNPDWGERGSVDNPSLEITDDDGQGPEVMLLDEVGLTSTLNTSLGIHYYSSNLLGIEEFGYSIALVKLYSMGVLLGEWSQQLQQTDAFWTVANLVLTFDEPSISEVNRVYDSIEDAN